MLSQLACTDWAEKLNWKRHSSCRWLTVSASNDSFSCGDCILWTSSLSAVCGPSGSLLMRSQKPTIASQSSDWLNTFVHLSVTHKIHMTITAYFDTHYFNEQKIVWAGVEQWTGVTENRYGQWADIPLPTLRYMLWPGCQPGLVSHVSLAAQPVVRHSYCSGLFL